MKETLIIYKVSGKIGDLSDALTYVHDQNGDRIKVPSVLSTIEEMQILDSHQFDDNNIHVAYVVVDREEKEFDNKLSEFISNNKTYDHVSLIPYEEHPKSEDEYYDQIAQYWSNIGRNTNSLYIFLIDTDIADELLDEPSVVKNKTIGDVIHDLGDPLVIIKSDINPNLSAAYIRVDDSDVIFPKNELEMFSKYDEVRIKHINEILDDSDESDEEDEEATYMDEQYLKLVKELNRRIRVKKSRCLKNNRQKKAIREIGFMVSFDDDDIDEDKDTIKKFLANFLPGDEPEIKEYRKMLVDRWIHTMVLNENSLRSLHKSIKKKKHSRIVDVVKTANTQKDIWNNPKL